MPYYPVKRGSNSGPLHHFYELVPGEYYSHAHGDLFTDGTNCYLYWNGDCSLGTGEEQQAGSSFTGTSYSGGSVVEMLVQSIEATPLAAASACPRGAELKAEFEINSQKSTHYLNAVAGHYWKDHTGTVKLFLTRNLEWILTITRGGKLFVAKATQGLGSYSGTSLNNVIVSSA